MIENKVKNLTSNKSQLDIPKYIDQPELIKNRAECFSLVTLGSMIWLWLLLPGISLLFWWIKGTIVYQQILVQSGPRSGISLIYIIFGISIFTFLFISWAIYNWIRFHSFKQKKEFVEVTAQQLALSFKVDVEDINTMQQAKSLVLHYGDNGQLDYYDVAR